MTVASFDREEKEGRSLTGMIIQLLIVLIRYFYLAYLPF